MVPKEWLIGSADRQVGSESRSSGRAGQGGGGEAGWSACPTMTNHDRLTLQVMASDCHAKSGGRCAGGAYPLSLLVGKFDKSYTSYSDIIEPIGHHHLTSVIIEQLWTVSPNCRSSYPP